MCLLNLLLSFMTMRNLHLPQFAGQNISTRTDGEEQTVSTHSSPGQSSHAVNGGAVSSHKRYAIHFLCTRTLYLYIYTSIQKGLPNYFLNYQFCFVLIYRLHHFYK